MPLMDRTKSKDHGPLYGALGVTSVAFVLAEIAIFLIYFWLEPEGLSRRLLVAGAVSILVSFPIGLYIHQQNAKLRKLTRKLAHIACTDQMSGLLNRAAFLGTVENLLQTPFSGPSSGSFLYIDVDHFKKLNDRFGHSVGDTAIKMIADSIKATANNDSLVGRMGGEEFGIFLPNANQKMAVSVAENVRRGIRRIIFDKGEVRQQMSVSIGVSLHEAGQSLNAFIQQADERMYLAKAKGRNRVVYTHEKELPTQAAPLSQPA